MLNQAVNQSEREKRGSKKRVRKGEIVHPFHLEFTKTVHNKIRREHPGLFSVPVLA
jgi:hypothetical protein